RQQPEVVTYPGVQRDPRMAVGNFARRDPDLLAIFVRWEIVAGSEIEQHGADAFGAALDGAGIERYFQVVGTRHLYTKAAPGRRRRAPSRKAPSAYSSPCRRAPCSVAAQNDIQDSACASSCGSSRGNSSASGKRLAR